MLRTAQWYVLITRPYTEKIVHAQLQERSMECLLPLLRRRIYWKGKTKCLESAIFPGHCFVRLPSDETQQALGLSHVVAMVGSPNPHPVDDATIEALFRINACSFTRDIRLHTYRQAENRVLVILGPFSGIRGEIVGGDQLRLLIGLHMIGQAVSVPIARADVVPVRSHSLSAVHHRINAVRAFFYEVLAYASSRARGVARAILR